MASGLLLPKGAQGGSAARIFSRWSRLLGQLLVCSVLLANGQVSAANVFNALERGLMPGELHRTHAKLESDCGNCHEAFNKGRRDDLCVACHDHERIKQDRQNKSGYHGSDPVRQRPCAVCHEEHKGRETPLIVLNKPLFNHESTAFRLDGAHLHVDCGQCHAGKTYRLADARCIACHKKQDVHAKRFGEQCADCHGVGRWFDVTFPHDKTRFALKDRHTELSCAACHVTGRYLTVSRECGGCHGKSDVHRGSWGDRCEKCHNEKGWPFAAFDHRKTKFPLAGKHDAAKCEACHAPNKKLKDAKCVQCHQDEHEARYGEKCAACHNTLDWGAKRFSHSRTKFLLTGKHKETGCGDCHIPREKTPIQCAGCHAFVDVHQKKQGDKCELCHDEKSWELAVKFDHELTRFPLLGSHAGLACEDCHQNKQYVQKRECVACHDKEDKHKGILGKACEGCHSPSSWKVWRFDHDKKSKFRLEGAHKGIVCGACHLARHSTAKDAPSDCATCHLKDDVHVGRFGNACERCHTQKRFTEIKKEISRQ